MVAEWGSACHYGEEMTTNLLIIDERAGNS
jgi:hypothetical protein